MFSVRGYCQVVHLHHATMLLCHGDTCRGAFAVIMGHIILDISSNARLLGHGVVTF